MGFQFSHQFSKLNFLSWGHGCSSQTCSAPPTPQVPYQRIADISGDISVSSFTLKFLELLLTQVFFFSEVYDLHKLLTHLLVSEGLNPVVAHPQIRSSGVPNDMPWGSIELATLSNMSKPWQRDQHDISTLPVKKLGLQKRLKNKLGLNHENWG